MYAEAYVNVNQYDIVLDVLVVNQTADTLQNCTIELATLGDLKLVERPQPMVLGPMDFCSIKANVKVSDYYSLTMSISLAFQKKQFRDFIFERILCVVQYN